MSNVINTSSLFNSRTAVAKVFKLVSIQFKASINCACISSSTNAVGNYIYRIQLQVL